MRRLTLLAVLAVLAAPVAALELPNVLTNPSFETLNESGWAQGWEIWPPKLPEAGAVSIDSTVAHTGQRSLRLRHANAGSYTRGQQVLTLEPNTRYAFTMWIRADSVVGGAGSMGARLYVEGIAGTDHATEATFGTGEWRQLIVGPYNSGAGGRITVMCYLHQATGTVWFDDLQAFKVTPEWDEMMERKRLQQGLDALLSQAEAVARQAGDKIAQAELAALRVKAEGVKLPGTTNFRSGPPFNDLDAAVYAIIARLNARRVPASRRRTASERDARVVAWTADPFEALPPLGLVPQKRALAAAVVAPADDREQIAINLCNLGPQTLRARVTAIGFGERITLREAVHVETRDGRLIADPLPRLQDGRMTLPPGVFRQLWCDISTAGGKAGLTAGVVKVALPGQPPIVCPITLRVTRAKLPAMAPIATWNYSYPTWPLLTGRWDQAKADLVAHRINSYCWPSDTLPWPQFDAQGKLLPLDWTSFDKAVASHGPIQWLLLWPGFEWPKNVALRQDGLEPGTPVWHDRFAQWFRAMIAGLKERGFGYDRVAWYLRDEPTTMAAAQNVLLTGQAVHQADPKALVVENPYNAATLPMLETMAPAVDIWCPALPWPQGDLLAWFQTQAKKSGILWTYQVLSKDSDAFMAYRLSFWDCWRKGMTGQGFWDYADTAGRPDNWGPYPPNGALYSVIYDGDPEELIPSRRWEAWREGTEDFTLLDLLKRARPQSTLLRVPVEQLMAKPTPAACAALRARVLEELAQ